MRVTPAGPSGDVEAEIVERLDPLAVVAPQEAGVVEVGEGERPPEVLGRGRLRRILGKTRPALPVEVESRMWDDGPRFASGDAASGSRMYGGTRVGRCLESQQTSDPWGVV